MNCPKCGTLNNINSSFCLKCGTPLAMQQNVVSSEVYTQAYNQSAMTDLQSVSKPFHIIAYMIALLMKPWTSFKEEKEKLSNTKNAFILTGIIGIIMMLVNLIKVFIKIIFTKKMNYSTWKMETKIDFSGLKDLDYVSLIGKNLLIYIGIIIAIAIIYYLGTLVIKKSVKFQTILSTTASSFIPFVIFSMLLAPILGKVWNILEMIIFLVGIIYAITIFMTLMNNHISFQNQDYKIYFHVMCISIIICVGYYAFINLLMSELGGMLKIFS